MKRLGLVMPVFGQGDSALDTLLNLYSTATYPNDIICVIIDNGSEIPVSKWLPNFSLKYPFVNMAVICNEENQGVAKSLNEGWKAFSSKCCTDFIYFIHSDVTILEQGWDTKLYKYLDKLSKIGVVGFGGAKGFGHPSIYKTDYKIWQLARQDFLSNMVDAENHGRRMTNEIEPVAVLDGFSMIVNRKFLEESGGFDENFIFHMYDNDLCLRSLESGYYNFVLNVSCQHHGGITSTREDYDKWLRSQGIDGDSQVHTESHVYFYEKWKDRNFIPIQVR